MDIPDAPSPITAEIIRQALLSIPNQIDVNITRTAYSPLIYEYKDYAVGIVDPEGRLISQAQGGIPLFFANALGVAVRDGLRVHGADGIEAGDVIITNDPKSLGQHLNNVVMYTPIDVGTDRFGFMAVLVHWVDIGGDTVGSFVKHDHTDIFQEGIQYRSVKLFSRGKPVRDIYRMIESNTRFPREVLGDLEAQLAGCLHGRDMVLELVGRYEPPTVRAAIELLWKQSETAARASIAKLADGTYQASSFLDNDGVELDKPITVAVEVRIAGDEMVIDLSGCSEQARGPVNSGREGGAETAARIAFKYLIDSAEPPNEGSYRPIRVVIPEGRFLSATGTAPLGSYSFPLATVIDTIIKALVPVLPEHVAAGHHGNFAVHLFYGVDPKTGGLFQHMETSHGGWGASLGHDGPGPYKTMAHGDTLDVPGEVLEQLYPLRLVLARLKPDTGGPGEFRGGCGVERLLQAVAPCTVRVLLDRTVCKPWGILGGHDGEPPATFIERPGEQPRKVLKTAVQLEPGDRVRIISGGGGGYGDPRKRNPRSVAEDVVMGNVSRDAAARIYGVSVDDAGAVLSEATTRLRAGADGSAEPKACNG